MKKSEPENLKTRPDMDDQTWIVWLQQQPEYKAMEIAELYRSMLEWCIKKGKTPTRLRLLNWLNRERESMPMTFEPPYFENPNAPCTECNGEGRLRVNDFSSPCPKCKPAEEKAFWKARGR